MVSSPTGNFGFVFDLRLNDLQLLLIELLFFVF